VATGDVVVEDAPHHRRLGLEDRKMGGPCSAAGDAPVAVGRLPGDDLARAGAPQLAAPVALGDLGPLVLSDHPLHLGEQPGLGVVVQRWRIREPHRHAEAGQLVQHDHLVGVGPGQPVG
jgi:hypothetical protein